MKMFLYPYIYIYIYGKGINSCYVLSTPVYDSAKCKQMKPNNNALNSGADAGHLNS